MRRERKAPPVATTDYLVVGAGTLDWAVESKAVLSVIPAKDWQGEPPLDVAGMLGATGDSARAPCVLLTQAETGSVALLSRGPLTVKVVASHLVMELPSEVRVRPRGTCLRGVVMEEGTRAFFVIDPSQSWALTRQGELG